MRVLHVTDLLHRPGGAERYAHELARALERRGVVARVTGAPLHASPGPAPPGRYALLVLPALVRACARACRELRPDVIHAHHPLAHLVALTRGVPVVRTYHGDLAAEIARRRPWLAGPARLLPRARATAIGVSAELALRLGAALIPGAVDPARFHPATIQRGPGPWRIGALARLAPERGLDELLEAAALLVREGRDLVCRVAGAGPLRHRLARAGARLLGVRFELAGPPADPAAFLRDLDFYASPAPLETQGLAVLEAMATGLAIVARRSPGTERSLGGAPPAGVLVDAPDPAAFARALAQVMDDADFARRLATEARSRALARGWDDVAREHEPVYAMAVGRKTAGRTV